MKRRQILKSAGLAAAGAALGLAGCGGSSDAPVVTVAGADATQSVSAKTASAVKSIFDAVGTVSITPTTALTPDSGFAIPAGKITLSPTTSTIAGAVGDFSFVDPATGNTVKGVLVAGSLKWVVVSVVDASGKEVASTTFAVNSESVFTEASITLPTSGQTAGSSASVKVSLAVGGRAFSTNETVKVTVGTNGAVVVNDKTTTVVVITRTKTTGAA